MEGGHELWMAGVCVLLLEVVTGNGSGNKGKLEFVLLGQWEEMVVDEGCHWNSNLWEDGSSCRIWWSSGRMWLLLQVLSKSGIENQTWLEFAWVGLWEHMAVASGSQQGCDWEAGMAGVCVWWTVGAGGCCISQDCWSFCWWD